MIVSGKTISDEVSFISADNPNDDLRVFQKELAA